MGSTLFTCLIIAALADASLAFVLPTNNQPALLPSPPKRCHESSSAHCHTPRGGRHPSSTIFLPSSAAIAPSNRRRTFKFPTTQLSATTSSSNSDNNNNNNPVEITFPTPEAAASMGIRDWPQQFHSSAWSDPVAEGSIATRYVLDGRGRLSIDYYDDDGNKQRLKNKRVYPGTLVEVDGEAELMWEVDDEKEGMVVLTPGYEEGGKLAIVGGFLVVFCAGLLIGSGSL